MLSKQIDVWFHKLGFDYWKCVYNAKLIIKPRIEMYFFRDLNDFSPRDKVFQYAES